VFIGRHPPVFSVTTQATIPTVGTSNPPQKKKKKVFKEKLIGKIRKLKKPAKNYSTSLKKQNKYPKPDIHLCMKFSTSMELQGSKQFTKACH
jgi:hypothetical protein